MEIRASRSEAYRREQREREERAFHERVNAEIEAHNTPVAELVLVNRRAGPDEPIVEPPPYGPIAALTVEVSMSRAERLVAVIVWGAIGAGFLYLALLVAGVGGFDYGR